MMVDATPLFPLMFSLILLYLSIANGVHCYGEKKAFSLQRLQWNIQPSGHSLSCLSGKSRRENGATVLEMKHRDYCSGKIVDWSKKLQKRLILDNFHVQLLQSRIGNMAFGAEDAMKARMPLTSGINLHTLNYIVTIELGGQNMTVIVDTGSDLTWVQCQPCKSCYNQKESLFNPSASHSYQSVLCNTSACRSLQYGSWNSPVCGTKQPFCNYVVNYGDGSYTRGELAREHLSLGKTPVKDFLFGCGRDNKGLFGGASGLMGLGRSTLSVISQSSALFGGVFSYCLPSTEAGASGSLVMGGDSSLFKNSTPFSYTKMVPNPQLSNFYFLNLTGISVGGVAVHAPSFAKGGVLIDSGTIITRLAPSVYKAVKAEFLKQFSGFPPAPGFSILDTCFNLGGYEEVDIPTLEFHFEGNAELNVDVTGIFYLVKTDASQVCLALASLSNEDEIGIVGNYQQKNQRIIYDTKQSKLGLAGETCSFR
ncbi:aspartyl protease family protein At5g10770-like [Juglans microcarpa x Juglans regia]|uniref:aspartyl protease family protein At5g10770-like n=1 Tax=Juglans microcarpa x Juglans regia TaxID=2249226 RepID=UPI001B7E1D04|nr:aspartyl protease family protein At5g10770-like [Juglans microcarpa x Juglans regia]